MKLPVLLPVRTRIAHVTIAFALWLLNGSGWTLAGGRPPAAPRLAELEFQTRVRVVEAATNDLDRFEAARALVSRHAVSSLQVKALARTIASEDLRLQFALAAYPSTVDPENFYEVYDAFQSFSKVFRLHDQIGRHPQRPPPPVAVTPTPLSEDEWSDLLRTLRNESFDNTRLAMAKQMVASARGRLASQQVRQMLRLFTFEDGRLELAKAAYDSVLDPWNYFVVYDVFTFASNREALVRYLESRPADAPGRPRPDPSR